MNIKANYIISKRWWKWLRLVVIKQPSTFPLGGYWKYFKHLTYLLRRLNINYISKLYTEWQIIPLQRIRLIMTSAYSLRIIPVDQLFLHEIISCVTGAYFWRRTLSTTKFITISGFVPRHSNCQLCKKNISESKRFATFNNTIFFIMIYI